LTYICLAYPALMPAVRSLAGYAAISGLGVGAVLARNPMSGTEDTFFNNAVILLTEYSSETGAKGFIVNKRVKCDGVLEAVNVPCFNVVNRCGIGGPLKQSLYNELLVWPKKKTPVNVERLILNYEADEGAANALCKSDVASREVGEFIKLYVTGFTGWKAGQVEEELRQGVWSLHSATWEQVFHTKHKDLYKQIKSLPDRMKWPKLFEHAL